MCELNKVWPHFGKKKGRATTYIKMNKIYFFGLDPPPIPLSSQKGTLFFKFTCIQWRLRSGQVTLSSTLKFHGQYPLTFSLTTRNTTFSNLLTSRDASAKVQLVWLQPKNLDRYPVSLTVTSRNTSFQICSYPLTVMVRARYSNFHFIGNFTIDILLRLRSRQGTLFFKFRYQ